MRTLRRSIFARVPVDAPSNVATTVAQIYVIEVHVAAAKRPYLMTSLVRVAGLYCKRLCHVGHGHHHATFHATEPRIVVTLRWHIIVI